MHQLSTVSTTVCLTHSVLSDTIHELKEALGKARSSAETDRVASASTIKSLHEELLATQERVANAEARASIAEQRTANLSLELGNSVDLENNAQQKLGPIQETNVRLVDELKAERAAHAQAKAQLVLCTDQLNQQALELGTVKLELAKIRSDEEDTMARLELQVIEATRGGNAHSPRNNNAAVGRSSTGAVLRGRDGVVAHEGKSADLRQLQRIPKTNGHSQVEVDAGETMERKEPERASGGKWLLSTLGLRN
jgi:hypothetical protein